MIESTYKVIDTIIKAQKIARSRNDFLALMLNGEALLEYLPTLINYAVDQEGEYRKFEANLANTVKDGKLLSSSYCETQAKATEYYREWQRAKNFIELLYEMVYMAKKLSTSVDKELKGQ
jgi:hypothetical protein